MTFSESVFSTDCGLILSTRTQTEPKQFSLHTECFSLTRNTQNSQTLRVATLSLSAYAEWMRPGGTYADTA